MGYIYVETLKDMAILDINSIQTSWNFDVLSKKDWEELGFNQANNVSKDMTNRWVLQDGPSQYSWTTGFTLIIEIIERYNRPNQTPWKVKVTHQGIDHYQLRKAKSILDICLFLRKQLNIKKLHRSEFELFNILLTSCL